MDFAAGDRLMTRETAACESPKCSASDLKLTLCLAGFRTWETGPDLERAIGVSGPVVSHIEPQRDKPYNRLDNRLAAVCYGLEVCAKSV